MSVVQAAEVRVGSDLRPLDRLPQALDNDGGQDVECVEGQRLQIAQKLACGDVNERASANFWRDISRLAPQRGVHTFEDVVMPPRFD